MRAEHAEQQASHAAAARANDPSVEDEARRPIEEEVFHGNDDNEEEGVGSETMDDVDVDDDVEEEQKVDNDEEEEQGGEMYWEQWCWQGTVSWL